MSLASIPSHALIECVPNISEGRRPEVIEAAIAAIKAVPGVRWLDQSSDTDHNRSVLTFVGPAQALFDAVMALYEAVATTIDLTTHTGGHPRMGAVDVVPFIPIADASMADCVALAKAVATAVAARFGVPVTLYEEAASAPGRRNLAEVRKGEFEGLGAKLALPAWTPDFGPAAPHPTLGASAIGAREPLVAYNIYLHTTDVNVAKEIAKAVRGSSGGLPHVKGMGLFIAERNQAQVSMNLVNFRKNPIWRVQELVKIEAARFGVQVASAEIVGLVPQEALIAAAAYYLQLEGDVNGLVLENRMRGG